MASLAELRRDGLLTDVALTSSFSDSASSTFGKTSVPAHRCVLAASSEYFRARFKERPWEILCSQYVLGIFVTFKINSKGKNTFINLDRSETDCTKT